jgi:hypothetical protein
MQPHNRKLLDDHLPHNNGSGGGLAGYTSLNRRDAYDEDEDELTLEQENASGIRLLTSAEDPTYESGLYVATTFFMLPNNDGYQ